MVQPAAFIMTLYEQAAKPWHSKNVGIGEQQSDLQSNT